jgi:zinc-ribbon domain
MTVKVGKPIVVTEVLSKSLNLVLRTPALLIPQVIVLVLSLLGDLANGSSQIGLELVLVFVNLVVSIIVAGAYPSMIQTAIGGGQPSVAHSFRQAAGRFWTLLAAGILVGLVVFLGFIALIVPGIIFATWYAYTVPAIMLENKGATQGMSSSKAFGRDKKLSTFILFLVIGVIYAVVTVVQDVLVLASPLLGHVVYSLLLVPVDAWIAVILTYAYITYGPSSAPAPGTSAFGGIPPAPMDQQVAQAGSSPPVPSSRFCRSCGSPIEPGSRFCSNCGQPV